jgi:hypothetical protein
MEEHSEHNGMRLKSMSKPGKLESSLLYHKVRANRVSKTFLLPPQVFWMNELRKIKDIVKCLYCNFNSIKSEIY